MTFSTFNEIALRKMWMEKWRFPFETIEVTEAKLSMTLGRALNEHRPEVGSDSFRKEHNDEEWKQIPYVGRLLLVLGSHAVQAPYSWWADYFARLDIRVKER